MNDTTKNITKAAFMVTLISAGGKFLGLIRESALAAYFGATIETDAYKLALGIPSILLGIVVASIATTFIPVYTEYMRSKPEEEVKYFVNNTVNIVLLCCIILLTFGLFLTPYIVRIIAPGFVGDEFNLTVKLTIISFPNLIFFALYYLGCGYLQTNKKFMATALTWVIYDVVIILCIIFLYKKGIEAVTIGSLIAASSLFLVQVPSILRTGYKYKPILDFKNEGFRKMAVLTGPVILSSSFNQLYIFIDRMLATGLNEGSLSALDYANRLNNLVYNVFILSLVTVMYPNLAFISEDLDRFRSMVVKGIKIIIFIGFPTMIGFQVLRIPIINLLFERGEFNSHDTYVTATALCCFAFGIIGVGLTELLNRVFFSLEDTKTPTINGIITICINIALNIIFVRFWGVGGLALATSLSALLSGGMLLLRLKRKIHHINGGEILSTLLKAGVAASFMGINVYFCYRLLEGCLNFGSSIINKVLVLIPTIGFGVIIYVGILYFLKVDELQYVMDIISNKLLKNVRKGAHGEFIYPETNEK